ncbi:MAG: helix-turn-helix transcriptional regulator [Candidatus Krumholzibacteriia bacterium]|nr:helix-turn-helix transcriptional regulator [bacterium]MCB9513438.1 helix-turn-helix transcriptional regulator [Candidatus Latescibacterota bacterium]MCB9516152.1 helix-turn-helix transcriptional regulator [Candidatus Latescibacterota bacterium]
MSAPPIGNCIRRLRFEHGEMTQQELAARCGVTRQTILALEAGRYGPSLALAFRIARCFERGVEEVFTWRDGEP